MAQRRNSGNGNQTPAQFGKEMQTFIDHMGAVVTESTDGRARFPKFRVTDEIREKAFGATERFAKGNIEGAFDLLIDVRRHFQNQQAAYARSLLNDLQDDLVNISDYGEQDLTEKVRRAVETYGELVGRARFDLEEASKVYWRAIDELNDAEKLAHERAEEQKRRDAEAARERRRQQDEATERARQLETERRRAAAENLNQQLAAL